MPGKTSQYIIYLSYHYKLCTYEDYEEGESWHGVS